MKWLLAVTLVLYLIGVVESVLYFARRTLLSSVALAAVGVGFLTHTGMLALRASQTGHGPYTNLFEYALFFSWAVILLYLVAEGWYRLRPLGPFVVPIGFVILLSALVLPRETAVPFPSHPFWLTLHRTLSLLGFGAFAVTFGAGLMYMIQEKQLKSHQTGMFYYRLPSLDILDEINSKSVFIGFLLITAGFLAGSLWSVEKSGSFFAWDPLRTFPLLFAWLIYAALFIGRFNLGWKGKRPARLGVAGFVAGILLHWIHIG
jgi:cytochrome c-type biogenesis protein CcsB